MTHEVLRRRRFGLDLLLAIFVACTLFGHHYRFEDLFAYVQDDVYQSLADAFRAGRLSVVSGSERIFVDTAPVGDDAYVVWGPFPAIIYAAFDIACSAVGLPPFPKAALFFATVVLHLVLVLRITRRLFGGGTWLPRIVMVCYAFSYPFWYAAHEAPRVFWVSILFSSTLFLFGLLSFARAMEQPDRLGPWAWSALALALAFLTRALYGLHLAVFAITALTVRPWNRRHAVFLGVCAFGLLLYFAYNHARFGDPLMFGEALIYQSRWDEEVIAKGVLPRDPLRTLAQWGEALFSFLALPEPPWSASLDTLYRHHQTFIFVMLLPLVLALIVASPRWVRTASAYRTELTLIGVSVVLILFYILWADEFEIRYQMDYVPALFVAGLKAAWDAARRRSPWLAPPLVALVAGTYVVLHALVADSVAKTHGVELPTISAYPHRMGVEVPGMWYFSGQDTGPSIRCEAIPTVHESASDLPVRQESLDRLGIFRFTRGKCEMLFFSGGTLRLDPAKVCQIELFLDDNDLDSCGRITFYRDGRPVGHMSEARTERPGERLCTFPLGITGERLVRADFLFEPVPKRSADWLRATKRYKMSELRATCWDVGHPTGLAPPDG